MGKVDSQKEHKKQVAHLLPPGIPVSGYETWSFCSHFVNTVGIELRVDSWHRFRGFDVELPNRPTLKSAQYLHIFVMGDNTFPIFKAN